MKQNPWTLLPGWIVMIVSFLYIRKMKGCECTDKNIVKRLHWIELLFMALSAFLLVSVTVFEFKLEKFIKTGIYNFAPVIAAGVATYLSLVAYFVYSIYEFYLGVSDCKCADDPMKYALYGQGFLYSTTLAAATISVGFYAYVLITHL